MVDLLTPPAAGAATTRRADTGGERRTPARTPLRRFVHHRRAAIGLAFIAVLLTGSVVATAITGNGFDDVNTAVANHRPSWAHPMGTDEIGRDLFFRVLRGSWVSLRVALVVAGLSTAVGAAVGALAGWYRGWVDALLGRLIDFALTIPVLAVLLVLANRAHSRRESWLAVAIVIAGVTWPGVARVTRSVFLTLSAETYVESARAVGASGWRIVRSHLLPNAIGPIIVAATVAVAWGVLAEAALAYLGFGLQEPATSLGLLIEKGKDASGTRPWLFYSPGLVLTLICLCVALIGDGLRDSFDPRR